MNKLLLALATALLSACSAGPAAAPTLDGISIDLETNGDWVQVTDQSDGDQYLREWVPAGSTAIDTDWIVVQQKFVVSKKTTPKAFLKSMINAAVRTCTDMRFNGPKDRNLGAISAAWGRIMCAQQRGKDYGSFTDLRVVVDGSAVYVVTSERRMPPSPAAGVIVFPDGADASEFMRKFEAAALVARESVRICSGPDC